MTTTTTATVCRVCYCDDDPRLIKPCSCSGTMEWVHRRCLDDLRCTSEENFTRCPTCKFKYVTDYVPCSDTVAQRRKLYRTLTLDSLAVMIPWLSLCGIYGWWHCQCSPEYTAQFYKYPYCGSTDPLVWELIGSAYVFYGIGIIIVILALVSGGGDGGGGHYHYHNHYHNDNTIPKTLNQLWWSAFWSWLGFLFFTIIGFVLCVGLLGEHLRKTWDKHRSYRKRGLLVHEYIVKDLASSWLDL